MFELDHKFWSFEDWMSWTSGNRFFSDSRYSFELAQRIIGQGFIEPLTRSVVKPSDIVPDSSGNWREGLVAFGKNSRIRAVLRMIEQQFEEHQPTRVTIYAPEAVTAMALCLRGRFPRFLGSEYASTVTTRDDLYPIPHEDLTCLTLRSDAFDLVTTNEVLEHVPSIDTALAEIVRILKPGGWHIGTHPFMFMNEKGVVRAENFGGEIKFLMEPEYHGNPVGSPSLVFETPGWDILHRARSAGFSSVYMRFVASERYGYLTENTGVFVLCCQK
jgi:SAM-dependent methyltransferase